jgi:hypothetical protein
MAKIPPDFSFVRDGRPLSSWLLDLVAEDRPTRQEAGEALGGMWMGLPRYSTKWSDVELPKGRAIAEQGERFKEAVKAAVDASGFQRTFFVQRLCWLRLALHEDWLERVNQKASNRPNHDKHQERLIEKILLSDDEIERAQAARRFCKHFCASLTHDKKVNAAAESMSASGMVSFLVFGALDQALLTDPQGLWAMLRDRTLCHEVLKALERIGPPAIRYAGFLLERLDQATDYGFDGARALGSIGGDDAGIVDALFHRLRDASEMRRARAAEVLTHMGPRLAGRAEEAVALLFNIALGGDSPYVTIPALASVGRERSDIVTWVLEQAAPAPPRLRPCDGFPEYSYDEVMHHRGWAIDALKFFTAFPDRVIPVLLEAFDSFQEYDPDLTYNGEHERVCEVLAAFGPAAAPSTARLTRYLEEWLDRQEQDKAWPKDVFRMFEAIGPEAARALPVLWHLRAHSLGDPDESPLDPENELDRAILALQGD